MEREVTTTHLLYSRTKESSTNPCSVFSWVVQGVVLLLLTYQMELKTRMLSAPFSRPLKRERGEILQKRIPLSMALCRSLTAESICLAKYRALLTTCPQWRRP